MIELISMYDLFIKMKSILSDELLKIFKTYTMVSG